MLNINLCKMHLCMRPDCEESCYYYAPPAKNFRVHKKLREAEDKVIRLQRAIICCIMLILLLLLLLVGWAAGM